MIKWKTKKLRCANLIQKNDNSFVTKNNTLETLEADRYYYTYAGRPEIHIYFSLEKGGLYPKYLGIHSLHFDQVTQFNCMLLNFS